MFYPIAFFFDIPQTINQKKRRKKERKVLQNIFHAYYNLSPTLSMCNAHKKWHSFQNCDFIGWRLVGYSYVLVILLALENLCMCVYMSAVYVAEAITVYHTWSLIKKNTFKYFSAISGYISNDNFTFVPFWNFIFRAINRSRKRHVSHSLFAPLFSTHHPSSNCKHPNQKGETILF